MYQLLCRVGLVAFGALLGGVVALVLFTKVDLSSSGAGKIQMSYADLSATLLSDVSVLVTILGVFIALVSIWGYVHFRNAAAESALQHVKSELVSGASLRASIDKAIIAHLSTELASGDLRRTLEEKVETLVLRGASIRAAEEAERDEVAFQDEPGEPR